MLPLGDLAAWLDWDAFTSTSSHAPLAIVDHRAWLRPDERAALEDLEAGWKVDIRAADRSHAKR